MKLNGWRRLALIFCGAWCLGAASLTTFELLNHREGYFVGLTLPIGTVVSGNKATLPGGRVVDLNLSIEGKAIKPWEIKWDNEPEVPTEQFIRWTRLLIQGLIIPVGLWVCFELFAFIGNWVTRGFRE